MTLRRLVIKVFDFFAGNRRKDKKNSSDPLAKLQGIIGYRFHSVEVLKQALKHKSAISADDPQGLLSNERLEFLGDAVLNCLMTEHLYFLYPERDEGHLSKIKSLLVSRKILGEIGLSFDIGAFIVFGASEAKAGGSKRLSILSNAFEALLGAIFLDGGIDAARRFLAEFLFKSIDRFLGDESNVNYKSMILEMAQRDGVGMPRYITVSAEGPEHAKEFTVRLEIAGMALGEGSGLNKKIAQQNAAQNAITNYNYEAIHSHGKGA